MTDQRELDRLLGAFFAEGTNELADRVIDAALDQIDHTHQRRPLRVSRRFPAMTMPFRLAAAAVIGVLAVGGAFYLIQPGKPGVAAPGPTPGASASQPVPTPTAQPTLASPVPTVVAGPMGTGRQIHSATPLADGRVLIAGGYDSSDGALASAVLYDPTTDTFTPTGSLAAARGLHTATRLSDGRILIAGGGPVSWVTPVGPYLATAELYDPTSGTFSPTGSMTIPREDHTATLLADGRVLITGGNDVGDHGVTTAELYDPKTGTFSPTGHMSTARGFQTATRLSDGRVLIVGGDRSAWSDNGPFLDTAELYDPKTGTFAATGSLTDGRAHHAATLLADGRVLITGGVADSGATSLASAELYDPKSGTFTATGPMTVGRVYHTATRLTDGRLLVAGGLPHGRDYSYNPLFLASAEIYDPKTGTFAATGSMTDMRTYQTATLLGDGRVLVAGGYGVPVALPTAEIYDPKTGTFSPAGAGG